MKYLDVIELSQNDEKQIDMFDDDSRSCFCHDWWSYKLGLKDNINPKHYKRGAIECIDAIQASLSKEQFKGYLKASAIKYLWRYEQKNGLEDLQKADWFLQRLIKEEQWARDLNQGQWTEINLTKTLTRFSAKRRKKPNQRTRIDVHRFSFYVHRIAFYVVRLVLEGN